MRGRQYQKSSIKRFWRRRLDGIGLDTLNRVFLAIEFKRTQDARSNYVERAAAAAQDQCKSLLAGLQAVDPPISPTRVFSARGTCRVPATPAGTNVTFQFPRMIPRRGVLPHAGDDGTIPYLTHLGHAPPGNKEMVT